MLKSCEDNDNKRSQWEIDEDYRAVKRALLVFNDKERLKDVQDEIKKRADSKKSLESIAEGDFKEALGLS